MTVFPDTDWGDWTPEEYQVGAPGTALHFERWFRNVVAAFQGAVGAPKLRGAALDIFLGTVNVTGNAGQGWVGLDRLNLLLLRLWGPAPTASGTYILRVRFTGDNGTTWGSWQNLRTSISNGSLFIADMRLNLDTGEYGLIRDADGTLTPPTGVLVVPPNCNGLQFSWSANNPAGMVCEAWAMGGRA